MSVFVSQEINLASLGGDGKVKDNVYRMMFAVMTNEVGRIFNWSGKHGWRGDADRKKDKFQDTNLCRVVTRKCMMMISFLKVVLGMFELKTFGTTIVSFDTFALCGLHKCTLGRLLNALLCHSSVSFFTNFGLQLNYD